MMMGGDQGGLWARSHFPSHGEYFSQGYLVWRQGRNACKMWRQAPLQLRAVAVSHQPLSVVCHYHRVRSQECLQLTQPPGDP